MAEHKNIKIILAGFESTEAKAIAGKMEKPFSQQQGNFSIVIEEQNPPVAKDIKYRQTRSMPNFPPDGRR